MNILHIAPYYPSVNAVHAGGVAMGKEIETLCKQGHKVYCLSFVQKEYDYDLFSKEHRKDDRCVYLNKKRKFRNILIHLTLPFYFATRNDKEFRKNIEEMVIKYNINMIHAEYSAMLEYVDVKKKFLDIQFNAILHDVTIQSYERKIEQEKNMLKRLWLQIEALKIKKYEKEKLSQCNCIVSFSEKDKKLIYNYYGLSSNVISTYFNLEHINRNCDGVSRKKDDYYSICFLGQMGRPENIKAAIRLETIFSKLNIKNKQLHLVGAKPTEEICQLAKRNVIVTGFVKDVDKYIIENCDLACFPLDIGAGIKIKVLECLSLNIPVVTNQIGAEGIDEDGNILLLADSDNEFIDKIELAYQNKMEIKGKNFVQKYFNWNITIDFFDKLYGKEKK